MDGFAEEMTTRGYSRTASLLPSMLDDIMPYLRSCMVRPGCHVAYSAGPATSWESAINEKVLCWDMKDVVLCPHLLDFAMTRVPYAQAWLGVDEPLLYSVNIFCTRPDGPIRPDIQDWHQDKDDVKFVPLFVCLTGGVVQQVRMPDGRVNSIEGVSAGEAFFSNTMLDHRGLPPTKERIVFWARWGVSDPPASYIWDKLEPIDKALLGDRYPTDLKMQRMMKLIAC